MVPAHALRRRLSGNQPYPTQQAYGIKSPSGLSVSNQVLGSGVSDLFRWRERSGSAPRTVRPFARPLGEFPVEEVHPVLRPGDGYPIQRYEMPDAPPSAFAREPGGAGGLHPSMYPNERVYEMANSAPTKSWKDWRSGPGMGPTSYGYEERAVVPSDYGYGNANGYVSRPMDADPELRQQIRNRVYREQMAPSQLGPYGSLGGSSGRGEMMRRALEQEQSMAQGGGASPQGGWSRPGMTFEEKMNEVRQGLKDNSYTTPRRNSYNGAGTMLEPGTGDYYRDENGKAMFFSPQEWAARQHRQGLTEQARERRHQQNLRKLERRRELFGAATGNNRGFPSQQGRRAPVGLPPQARGWVPPDESFDGEARAESLQGLADFLDDPGATLDQYGGQLNSFSRDEIRGLIDDNTGWGEGGDSLWDQFWDPNYVSGGDEGALDPESAIMRKRRLRRLLQQHLESRQGM